MPSEAQAPITSRELRMVFVAFLLDPICCQFLQEGRFPDLRAHDAVLYASLSRLATKERGALIRNLQAEAPLKDFEQAA